jgi:hypothetical protein
MSLYMRLKTFHLKSVFISVYIPPPFFLCLKRALVVIINRYFLPDIIPLLACDHTTTVPWSICNLLYHPNLHIACQYPPLNYLTMEFRVSV